MAYYSNSIPKFPELHYSNVFQFKEVWRFCSEEQNKNINIYGMLAENLFLEFQISRFLYKNLKNSNLSLNLKELSQALHAFDLGLFSIADSGLLYDGQFDGDGSL